MNDGPTIRATGPEPVTATATDASTEASTDAAADATSDVVAFDAPVDAIVEAAVDAGACGLAPVDGGAYNSLASTGAASTPACKNGSPPTAIGGSILDGRYVLTKMEIYNQGGSCPTQAEQIDWSICGNPWETVQSFGQDPVHTNVSAQNNGLALSLTCPPARLRRSSALQKRSNPTLGARSYAGPARSMEASVEGGRARQSSVQTRSAALSEQVDDWMSATPLPPSPVALASVAASPGRASVPASEGLAGQAAELPIKPVGEPQRGRVPRELSSRRSGQK